MTTQIIPPNQWVPFLDQFSLAHHGEKIQVRVIGASEQQTSQVLPLEKISDALATTGQEKIEITAGTDGSRPSKYDVNQPIDVRVRQRDEASGVIRIKAADGSATVLRFSSGK